MSAYPISARSRSVNASYQERLQAKQETNYRNYRVSLINHHLGNWCPLKIAQIVESYLLMPKPFPVFPVFPAGYSFLGLDKSLFHKQFIAFYHHCKLYSSSSGDKCLKGRKTEVCKLDLISQNLVWREQQDILCINNVSVETWIESELIAFNGLYENELSHTQKWTFELDLNGRSEIVVYYLEKDRKIPLREIQILFIFLDGNEFECHTLPRPSRSINRSIKDKTWDLWKEKLGSEIATTRSVIFPLFVKAISHICSVVSKPSVLDIGGCDGDLGFFLLDRCQEIDSYTIIEKSEPLSRLADTRSKCDCSFHSKNREKLKAICGDIRNLEILEANGKKQSDVNILCGVIAEHVLSRSASLKLVENCKRSLKDWGFLLVAAYSNHHFNADDYRSMGFIVLNKSFSFMDDETETPRTIQFYVLQIERLQDNATNTMATL